MVHCLQRWSLLLLVRLALVGEGLLLLLLLPVLLLLLLSVLLLLLLQRKQALA
jgi:hypothetical protein